MNIENEIRNKAFKLLEEKAYKEDYEIAGRFDFDDLTQAIAEDLLAEMRQNIEMTERTADDFYEVIRDTADRILNETELYDYYENACNERWGEKSETPYERLMECIYAR